LPHRVVVTGLGLVTPVGTDVDSTWASLLEGRSGAGTITKFDPSKLSFYAATCYTWLGDRDHAREHAEQVIHQCLELPGQVRWPIRLAETRVDLGLVAAGEVDKACELGRQALASERKSGSTLGRVAELDALLTREHPDAGEVVHLHEQFEAARRSLT